VGLKPVYIYTADNHIRSSNRTIVGLKRTFVSTISAPSFSSNRTIVGLKLNEELKERLEDGSSNRTIVGLKQQLDDDQFALCEQQSHHCGIETSPEGRVDVRTRSQAAIAPLWD